MFNFTTQTVYNQISTTGANQNLWVASAGKKPALRIGNTRFDKADILDVQVKNPTVEQLASVTFPLDDLVPASGEITARVVLYIGLSMNCQDAFYANNFVYKGKPLYIEFPVKSTDSGETVGARIKAIAKKYLNFVMGEKLLNISADTEDNATSITFEAVNGYQIIKKASLQVFNPEAKTVDCCSKQGEYEDVLVGVPVIYTTDSDGVVTATETKMGEDGEAASLEDNEVAILPGLEAFGDYNWILHNLRLPTLANQYVWSPTNRAGENPVPGQVYTQFVIRMLKERDGIMGEIVGARGTSVTTHVLYVAGKVSDSSSAAYAVNGALSTLLGADAATKMLTVADDALEDPYHTA